MKHLIEKFQQWELYGDQPLTIEECTEVLCFLEDDFMGEYPVSLYRNVSDFRDHLELESE